MSYACQQCRLEKGYTTWLKEENGILVCEVNPEHKYQVKKDGFLHPL